MGDEDERPDDDDGLRQYLDEIARFPLLAPEDDVRLAKAIEAGDDRARSQLIESNLRLVVSISRRYDRAALGLRDRIQEGIRRIAADEDVRLAFCFANKAIAVQAGWRRQPIKWRSFQLAFILLNIPAIADPTSPDRSVCDLLWFPTGGGKTEAYLALAAFVMAYRRRRGLRRREAGGGGGTAVLSRYTLRLLTIQQFRRALAMVTACG